ncbi:MAG: pseudouridine synthase [Longimicrobiales bacterium]
MSGPVRLQKFLSNAGVASRRKAEALILAGRVTVNGTSVTELGTRVDPERDRVAVDSRPVVPAAPQWIALHKPAGYLTSRGDPYGRPTIYELLPSTHRGLFYVGRLDAETEGLLLLTNDGDLAQRLQHPRYGVQRFYEVTVNGEVADSRVTQMLGGLQLEDGPARLQEAAVLARSPQQTTMRVTLAEGRKREVRRIFSSIGHEVMRLRRIRYGPIELGTLNPGAWRPLSSSEVAALESDLAP